MSPLHNAPSLISATWILPVDQLPVPNAYLRVHGGIIEAVETKETYQAKLQQVPWHFDLITPGLINTHAHLNLHARVPMPILNGESMGDWLMKVVSLRQDFSASEAAMQNVQACLQHGTTCVNDIASGPESLLSMRTAGLRGRVSLEFFHPQTQAASLNQSDKTLTVWHTMLAAQKQLAQDTCGKYPPLVSLGLSPHSPYNVSPVGWQAVLACLAPHLPLDHDVWLHSHLDEWCEEKRYYQGELETGIAILHQGLLGQPFTPPISTACDALNYLGHMVWTHPLTIAHGIFTQKESLVAWQKNTPHPLGLAHCPRSNVWLHGQTANIPMWDELNIPVGLGTDSLLSCPDWDIRAEARAAQQQQGWSASRSLKAATLVGATAMGMDQTTGSLTPGKMADWVGWQVPEDLRDLSPEAQWLHPRTQPLCVVIAGKIAYHHASTLSLGS
jgi:cytosine/adenosine deaminase-related metal-dependent hydrolase